MKELSPESEDEHVSDLSERVRAIIAREEGKLSAAEGGVDVHRVASQESNEAAAAHHEFRRVSSIDEQEETEKAS